MASIAGTKERAAKDAISIPTKHPLSAAVPDNGPDHLKAQFKAQLKAQLKAHLSAPQRTFRLDKVEPSRLCCRHHSLLTRLPLIYKVSYTSNTVDQPQPINSVTTSAETAYTGEGPQPQMPRFTRAERRQFKVEKKAGQQARKPAHKDTKFQYNSIDDVIAYLVGIRGMKKGDQARALSRVARSFEATRITHDEPKKELSSKKLEKIQKRREIRAEKKKAWLAKKADAAQSVPPAAALAPVQPQLPLPDIDEINYDDL